MGKSIRKKTIAVLGMVLMLIVTYALQASAEVDKPQVIYFFENYCESCNPEEDFKTQFGELTGKKLDDYLYSFYNVKEENSRVYYSQMMDELGIPDNERFLPTAIVDGKVYSGASGIQEKMPADFTPNDSSDSLIYYLYSPTCENCEKAESVIDALPESMTVTRGMYTFNSKIEVVKFNIYENAGIAQALFERYDVPEKKRVTPIVFMRDTFFSGADSIARMMEYELRKGGAIGTPLITKEETDLSGLTWVGSITAGLVAGFNPCALSMLLLFLSVLMQSTHAKGKYAAIYLGTKLIMYILIGTAFVSILSAWNPVWLPLATKVLLTIIGGAMFIMNIMDAIAARRERYGKIHNQLPRKVRGFLHTRIKSLSRHGEAFLLPAVIFLGTIVAISEFMCSGQLYLALLTTGFEIGMDQKQNFIMLVIFCMAFILPSAVLAMIVVKGQSSGVVSQWLLKEMPLIKVATAIVMLAVIVIAWVV